ncbi:50S ribosomal protein L44e [Candidatus Micrarchaeota archaeon]|nr:50S ribosomal protein L44e [Candidatus Micrarchaeota archaeon]MBU1166512.1 50S ribosomal protein L44e [Candidatus Micrarchaeota archaeon]MBU1887524.1 50S ribosomal protein L44e [Candidatus Micrarchaeota archaeon]
MKFPKEINAYCSSCRAHKVHKVKLASKGRPRTLAKGNRAHQRSLMGHGSKRAGEKTVKKQGKKQKLMLQCSECKKKQERVVGGRTTKRIELQA